MYFVHLFYIKADAIEVTAVSSDDAVYHQDVHLIRLKTSSSSCLVQDHVNYKYFHFVPQQFEQR